MISVRTFYVTERNRQFDNILESLQNKGIDIYGLKPSEPQVFTPDDDAETKFENEPLDVSSYTIRTNLRVL